MPELGAPGGRRDSSPWRKYVVSCTMQMMHLPFSEDSWDNTCRVSKRGRLSRMYCTFPRVHPVATCGAGGRPLSVSAAKKKEILDTSMELKQQQTAKVKRVRKLITINNNRQIPRENKAIKQENNGGSRMHLALSSCAVHVLITAHTTTSMYDAITTRQNHCLFL